MQGLLAPEEDVEADELGRDLGRELADPALGGVEAHLERVEVERTAALDHDLPVHSRPRRQLLGQLTQLGEVAQERAGVPAPDVELALDILDDSPETVPFRLVLPLALGRELIDELGLHGREGQFRGGHGCGDYRPRRNGNRPWPV